MQVLSIEVIVCLCQQCTAIDAVLGCLVQVIGDGHSPPLAADRSFLYRCMGFVRAVLELSMYCMQHSRVPSRVRAAHCDLLEIVRYDSMSMWHDLFFVSRRVQTEALAGILLLNRLQAM